MARLMIHLLGTFRVALDGVLVTGFESEKSRALLAYLAAESDHVHRRERLAGLLWPDFPERRARQSLSQALSNIRAVIGDRAAQSTAVDEVTPHGRSAFLEVTRHAIGFDPLADTWVDVAELAGCAAAPRLLVGGALPWTELKDPLDPRLLEQLDRAAALYTGPFLDDLSLSGCADFEEWVLIQRERFERSALAALRVLTAGYVRLGECPLALAHAWRQLEMDRLREDAHRQVMALLAMTGQRSAALAQYDVCCRMLADEIGVDPEPATAALVERIKSGALGGPASGPDKHAEPAVSSDRRPRQHPAVTDPPSIRHNLPAQLTPCVGREREIVEVMQSVTSGTCRLVTLVGPGGIGKTRLALEVARRVADGPHGPAGFPDGVFFVSLATAPAADAIVPAIARGLGLSFSAKGSDSPAMGRDSDRSSRLQLMSYLREKQMLLVLDNFEHLLDGATMGVELLQAAPGLTLLITSRARLNVLSECLYRVPELALPDDGAVPAEGATECTGALELFAWSARRLRPALRLEGEALGDAVAICRQVGGMPLAVLLATTWLTLLPPSEIRRQLDGAAEPLREGHVSNPSLDFLRSEWPDIPERQRSMRQVFEQSWRLLTREEQSVFRALSVLRGGFTRAAAQQIAGAGLHVLRALADKSLLTCSADGRYAMHELLRQFAAEKLASDSAAREQAQAAYTRFYVGALEAWYQSMKGPRQQDVIREMDAEIGNARAAWDRLVASADVRGLSSAVDGLCTYYRWRVRREEGLAACEAAAEALDRLRADLGLPYPCELVRASARVASWRCWFDPQLASAGTEGALGEAASVAHGAEPALAMIQAHRDDHGTIPDCDLRPEEAALVGRIGDIMWGRDRREARRLYQRARELAAESGDLWAESKMLRELSWLAWALGELAAAQTCGAAALEITRGLGDLRGMADSLQALSGVAMMVGRLDESAVLAAQCLEIARELGDPLVIGSGSYTLGFKYVLLGRFEEAIALLQRCQGICRDLGLDSCLSTSVEGWAHSLMGDHARGLALQEKALELSARAGAARSRAWSLMIKGRTLIAQERFDEAVPVLLESVETYRPIQQPMELAMALCSLGLARCKLGQLDLARPVLAEALSIGVTTEASLVLVCALPDLALLFAHSGRSAEAAALYRACSRVSIWLRDSPWYQTVFRDPLTALCPGELLLDPEYDGSAAEAARALLQLGRDLLGELVGEGAAAPGDSGDEEPGSQGARA